MALSAKKEESEVLDDRKSQVLRAVIEDYIETAEPVGSRTIARKHRLGVSPATIRNEMADLEETGYLEQPHVSRVGFLLTKAIVLRGYTHGARAVYRGTVPPGLR